MENEEQVMWRVENPSSRKEVCGMVRNKSEVILVPQAPGLYTLAFKLSALLVRIWRTKMIGYFRGWKPDYLPIAEAFGQLRTSAFRKENDVSHAGKVHVMSENLKYLQICPMSES